MIRARRNGTSAFWPGLALSIFVLSGQALGEEKPWVLLITIDTLRADRTQPYGYEAGSTPTMLELAGDGVTFENAVVQTPITLPSHASILTGTYPMFHGLQDVVGRLREDVPTLGQWFQEAGYETAAFVGASVLSADWGLDRGFSHYDDEIALPAGVSQVEFDRVERPADDVIDRTLDYLRNQGQKPLFLWVHLYDPHDPYAPPEPYASRFRDRPYDGEIAFVDAQIGRLIGRLKQIGRYEKSLIIFTADHGEMLSEHGEEHHAFFIYEPAVRVPLILKLPDGRAGPRELKGVRLPNQVRSVDIAPTVLQILGAPTPRWSQGEGLLAFMLGRREGVDLPAYAETHYPRIHFAWSPLFSYSTGRHKYIQAPRPELYDLSQDPGESDNLLSNNQALANRLKEDLQELKAKYARPGTRAPSETPEVDSETVRRLQSLGYVALAAPGSADESGWERLPDPKDKIVTYNKLNRGMALSRQGRGGDSAAILKEVAREEPAMPLVHFLLGSEYAKASQFLQAIDEFKLTVKYNPGSSVGLFSLAQAYAAAGQGPQAAETAQRLIESQPTHYGARQLLAGQLAKDGNLEGAVGELRKVLGIRPDLAEAHNNLGGYLFSLRRLQEAKESYSEALRLAPRMVQARINLVLTLLQLGDSQQALQEAQTAVGLHPNLGLAQFYLGQSYLAKGMQAEAREAFAKAKQLDPRIQVPSH